MATDTTHLSQAQVTGGDDFGAELDFNATQLAAAGDAARPVQLPQGQRVVLIPVLPGQSLTLPTDGVEGLLAKIGAEGNLAIVVDGRTIIFQGYVAANETAAVRLMTEGGEELDVADLVAATDPALDIQTAAGPAAGAQGDTGGSGIFTPFVPGAGPGLIDAEGVLGATNLAYKTIDDTRRLFTAAEGEPDLATVETFAAINPAGEAFLKEDVETPIALIALPGEGDQVTQIVLDSIPAGWTVNLAGITLTEGSLGAVTLIGGTLTITVTGAAPGTPVSAMVPVTAAADSDVDGADLVVKATVVDGSATATASSTFDVVVDAVLDQYLDVSQSAAAAATESGASQLVSLNLLGALTGAAGNPFANSFAGGAGADDDASEMLPTSATIALPNTAIDLVLGAGAPAGASLTETAPESGLWTLTAGNAAALQAALGFVQAAVPAGFDGTITGSVTVTTAEANTPEGSVPASGNEPDTGDNAVTDSATFSVVVEPDTSVETSAEVGTEGAAFLKEDVYGPIALTAYPGATDHVTEIVLSNIPADWDVRTGAGDITLSSGTLGSVSFAGGVLTLQILGAVDGVAVTATIQAKAGADSDIDGADLTLAATAVDGDGGESATSSSNFNVAVDAVLDQYLDVSQSATATATERNVTQYVGLNLTSLVVGGAGNPFGDSFAGGAGADNDGSELLPAGARITVLNTAIDLNLAAGFPAGTTLTETAPNSGMWVLNATSAANLQLALGFVQAVVPAGFDGTVMGSIAVTTQEANTPEGSAPASGVEPDTGDNAVTDTTSFSLTVSNAHCNAIHGSIGFAEDGVFNQFEHTLPQITSLGQIGYAGVVSLGVGEALTALTITGIPAGATLTINSAAVTNGVPLTAAQLADWIGGAPIVVTPAADRDVDFSLAFSGQTTDTSSGAVSAIGGDVAVRVDAAADDPTNVTIDAVSNSGDEQFLSSENGTVRVTASFGDTADGTEAHSLVITAPAGFVITGVADYDGLAAANFSGLGTGVVVVTIPGGDAGVGNLVLNVQAPASYAGGTPTFTVTAVALDAPTDQGIGIFNIDSPLNNLAVESASDGVTFKTVSKPSAEDVTAKVDEDGIAGIGNNDSRPGDDNANVAPDTIPSEAVWREDLPVSWNGEVGTISLAAGDWSGLRSIDGSAIVAVGTGSGLLQGYDADDVTGGVPNAGATPIFEVQIIDAATGVYEVRLLQPMLHPDSNNNPADNATDNGTASYEDNLTVPVQVTYANSGGSVTKTLSIDVDDDSPVANQLTKSTTVSNQVDTNLLLVLDVSGSMADPSGLTGLNKLQLAVASIKELIEQYDARGDVMIQVVTFSTNAAAQSAGVWLTVDQAKAFLATVSANGYTNYDEALTDAMSAYANSGKIVGAQNVAYFLSDGNPNRPSGDAGIDSGEETAWTNFLKANDVNAYALGFGATGDVTPANLHPVAYNGAQEINTNATVVTDPSQLTAALASTVTTNVSGNLRGDNGNALGADGAGYVREITFGGTTFTFDGTTITRSGTALAFTQAAGVLTFSTDAFKFVVDMNSGGYVYTLLDGATLPANDSFGYTLSDADGDAASSMLLVSIAGGDTAPIGRDDTIFTNISGSGASIVVPDYALLWNDTDANGDAITVGAISNVNSLSGVSHVGDNVVITDNNSNGGSFTYEADAGSRSDTADVTVDRGQAGESTLDGNGLGNILVGRDGSNDTLNGYEGDDVLLGGGGKDTLNGGAGDDLLVGGAGNDTINLSSAADDNDTVLITSVLDGDDRISNFGDGVNNGGADSQDRIDLDPLFDSLGVATGDREARVQVSDGGSNAIITVDVDGDGFDAGDLQLTLLGIGNPSNISVGLDDLDDVVVGTA